MRADRLRRPARRHGVRRCRQHGRLVLPGMARTALLVGRSALCCDCRPVLRIVLGQPTGQGHSVVEQGARSLHELMGAVLPVKGGADSETPVQPDQFGQMLARFLGGSHSKGVHRSPQSVTAVDVTPLGIGRPGSAGPTVRWLTR